MALTRNVGNSVFGLAELELPPHIIRPWLDGIASESVVGTLAPRMPMAYGESQWFQFTDHEAQYVGEGQAKAGSDVNVKTGFIRPFKFQKTVRFPVEQLWRDEAYQLGMVQEILTDMVAALGRALDLGVIHAIDPRTGISVDRMDPALHSAPAVVDLAGRPAYAGVDDAIQRV
ncbi:MAG: major capsid protein, partial [Promicromonosporaceae bacterium]|nr:major capsid protein [Promicromonosporaceae bacterium]